MNCTKCSRCLLIAISVFLYSACFSQVKILQDSTGLHFYRVKRGDTLIVAYELAYIMNKNMYKAFQDNYEKVNNVIANSKEFMKNSESMVSLQESMLDAREADYQKLKTNFDSVVRQTNKFFEKTGGNIDSINHSVSNAEVSVNSIKAHIDSSLKELKLLQRQKLKWIVGGFTVGVGITAVLFAVAK